MQLYGNEIWNAATPNSEKAVMITEKEHLEAALKALDEAGVNYCYYVKDNEVTIAFAKIAVQRSELENLRKIPELSGLSIVPAKGDYTPKTTVIGNTAYKDIQNRHYQKLETDLALKVANELHQNGIHFSGRIYGQSTTITIDSADKQEFERIVQDIVSVRNSYQRKLEGISRINENISALNEGSQIILKPLADMCYTRGEEFTNQLFTLIDEADDFTEQQLKLYSAEFMKIYEPLSDSEYLFADRTSLDRLKEQFAKDNLFDDVTYLRGYSTEQKAAIRYLIENTQYFPDVLYNMIDFNFSPSDIRRIGEIWKEDLSNAPERIYQLIGDIKGYDPSNVRNYIRLGTYIPDTAELDRFKYITDEYTTGENADGSVIYRIPIETNVGILNKLAENGVIEEGLQNAHLILESDGRDYNVILTLDNNDVQLGSIVISDFLTDREQSVVSNVVNEVIQSEQVKQLAHEADTDLDSKSSEGINDDLEQIVASIGEKGKTFTEMVKAGEFSKAGEILKEISVLTLQAEKLKAVIQQEAITTEDVDKLREIEPKRKSVQNMLETEVAQTPKFERLLGEELGEKSPYEMRRGNTDWRNDETATVPVVKISSLEIPPKITDIRKSEYLKGIQRGIFVNQDTGIEITFGRNAVDEIIAKAIPDAKRNRPIEGRLAAVHNISELIEKSICFDSEISDYDSATSKNKSPNTLFMHKLYSVFSYNGTYYLACLSVEEMYSRDPLDHDRICSTSNRLYSLKDIKITPTELGLDTHDLMPVGISSVPIGVIYDLTIPQLYEIVKEYDHSFYENEQSPGRAERLEEIQAQEDFQSSVEVLQSHISQQKQAESPFDKSVRLINEYCERVFDTKANFSNLDHVDLAFTSDKDTGAAIEVYADLETYRIVAEYGGKTARELLFSDLDEMNTALESLDFDKLVSLSDEEKQQSGVIYADIQNAVAEEEAEIAVQASQTEQEQAVQQPRDDFDRGADKFFFTENGVEEIYYNPDSSEGGQFVSLQISNELILEAARECPDSADFFSYLEGSAKGMLIDITSKEFNNYVDYFNRPANFTGNTEQTMSALIARARRELRQEQEQPSGTYKIYQVKSGEEYRYKRFESLERQPEPVNIRDYDLVYQGSLSDINGSETAVKLESLFDKFNTDHPADFKGHSLSVSDVIVIEKDGEQAAYFCDSIGYKELPDFFKEIERPQTITSENRIETVELKKESVQPKEEQTVSVPEESPQLSFDVTSTIPAKNEPDNTVLLDLNEYDDPDYYEQQQIAEQEAAEVPNPENFRITDSEIGSGTPLQRFNNNLAAIRLLKDLEADGRQASPEEQETLSRYVGWGGLAEFFKESNPHYQELRDLLTEDEYSSARATTLDSFYTSPVIIDSIYTVLQNSGFEGGNILEPSMGIGNFFGRMPQEMQSQSKLFGVEIDSLTGRIAKQLYPDAHIDIKGFEKTSFKNGSFDVAVGNIPFGDFSLQYDRQSLKIHDYFFMQALDKVKDGGIVAFVTSKGTLDKRDSSFRRMLAEKADLIGAVRLPNTAFKTAGTEVTADIIFLQKRQSPPEKMPDWVNIGASAAGLPINEYFVQHPEMVLGEIVQGNKMYGRNNDTMCVPFEGRELSELLPEAVSRIHAVFNAGLQVSEPMQNSEVQIPEGIRNYSYFEYKNNIYTIEDNEIVSLRDSWKRSYSPANIERAKAYIQIRDTVRELLAVQQETAPNTEDRIKELQAKLNTQYDSFYKKYGLMHSRFNSQLFRDDSSYPLMLSLEDKVDKDKLIRKSDIFFKRTIRVPEVVDKVDTPQEALVLSLAEKGKVDLDYMSALTDLPTKAIVNDLKGEIFPVPELSHGDNIVYQTASEYLSGDIYAKLSAAKFAAERNSVFADNLPALEAAIPTPLTAGEIDIECGATWIPKEIYQQFMYETFKTADEHRADRPPRFVWQQRGRKNIEIDYSPHTNKWNISNKSVDHSVTTDKTYGTKVKNAYTIFEAVLNLHIPNITKTVPDPYDPSKDKKVMDIEATKLVKRKAETIRKEFKEWIFKDPERRRMLVDLYNRQFNCIRPREYDGSHLQFHGMNASIELHQHQKNAIAHAIYGGNTLFAHCVGAGKTFEMIATAMESKRLGLCSKSLFAVPNHLTEQVGADFMKLYPNANILVATKKDFTKQNRSKLLAKIATGNYDAVIIGHSQLGMIPISPERQERMYKEQIEDITEGIAELKAQNGESFQVKAMERTRKSLQQKLEKLSSSKKDNTMYFEELGIDKLFVDEAHEFKNLMSVTKLQNVSGISGRTSQRATELFMKCRYLDEKTGGKGVVFATGTPVSNSITELHTMMRYLQYDFLSQHGMQNFDNWVSVFGKQKTDYELAPTGDKFKARTRIASYANMPELMTMFKQCADVRTSDSLNLPVPDCELHIVNTEPTELQQALVQELSARADDVQNGIVEPHEDNMLKITGDGRKVGLDPRLVNPDLEDDPNTKLNQCVRNVFQIWQDTAADKLTQIIFCDLGVPKPNQTDSSKDSETDEKSMADIDSLEESGTFCVYDDIKSKLVAMGIPKEEIAFIHDAKTEAQKSDLFEKVRSGEIRVLLGSTAKMGTGTNVQDRLIALHDLDVPWRPSDLEQRRGRMVRQGNINEKVHLYRYVTKGTFDAYSYQLLETKQRFISQVITSKTPARTCSDVDQEALTYSEIKALCTGDERIKEKLTLENRVKELQLFEKEYRDTHFELEDKVAAYPEKREQMCVRIEKLEQDFEKCKAIPFDEEGKPVFSMIINGTMYTDRKEAAEALKTALDIVYTDRDRAFPIGEIYGFKIFAAYDTVNECIRGIIKGELEYSVGLSTMPSVNVNKFEKLTIGIEKHLDDARKKLEQADIDIESAKAILAQPFEFAAELADKTERLADLTDELNAEAAERLQSTEKKPRTHYFGKDTILSIPKKEAPKKDEQEHSQEHDNKKGGEAI